VTAPILSFLLLLLLLYLFLFFFLHLLPCWNGDGFQEKGRRVSAAGDNSHLFFFLFLSRTNDDDQRGGRDSSSSSTSFSCSKVVVNHKLATYEKPLVSSLLLLLFTSFLSSSPARSFALARLYLAMLFYPCRTYAEKPLYSSMCTISCSLSLAAADGWEETCPAAEKGEGETSKREE